MKFQSETFANMFVSLWNSTWCHDARTFVGHLSSFRLHPRQRVEENTVGFSCATGIPPPKVNMELQKKTFISKHWNSSCIIQIWLVVQLFHLEKSWSSSMGFGWHPIYEMEKTTYVWNHQPEIQLRLSTTLRRHISVSFPPATSLAKSPRIHDCSAADASGPGGADLSFDINLSMGNFSIKHNILSIYIYITGYYWLLFAIIGYIIGYYWL